jgi:hypothetical protein
LIQGLSFTDVPFRAELGCIRVQSRTTLCCGWLPAGTFSCIRLLTTGRDGDIDLKRTIWFAPGKGIIREEKSRMREGKPIFREVHELVGMTKAS